MPNPPLGNPESRVLREEITPNGSADFADYTPTRALPRTQGVPGGREWGGLRNLWFIEGCSRGSFGRVLKTCGWLFDHVSIPLHDKAFKP